MNKKAIVIVIGVILLSVVVWAIFSAVKKDDEEIVVVNSNLVKMVDAEVISPIPSFDGTALWYFTRDGKLFRSLNSDNSFTEYPLPPLSGLQYVSWPKVGNDFISVARLENNNLKYFYNSQAQKYVPLPHNIQNFDWMPDGKKIVYIWRSGDNTSQQLAMANADSTEFKIISNNIFWPDFKVNVSPNGKEVLLVRSIVEGEVNKIYKANVETGKIETVIGTGKNLEVKWLDSDRFLYTQGGTTTYPAVYMYNLTSRLVSTVNINTSLDKIAVDKENKYLYAAVPKTDNSGDIFMKIDLTTLKQDVFFDPNEDVRGKELHIVGPVLYFVNTKDNKIYSVK